MDTATLRRVLALLALVLAVVSFVGTGPSVVAAAIALLAFASLL